MKFENKTLEELDELNLLALLKKISVGNIVRGCIWLVDSFNELTASFLPQEVEEIKQKKETKKRKSKAGPIGE